MQIIKREVKCMINIRPVSDLRNKYPEIEELVLKEDEAVYLTKNGYGSMVVMSLQKYEELISGKEYSEYIEDALDEAEKEAENENTKYLTHEEVFDTLRRNLDE
jgi:PHD/YefM family antitoxin component YafN of YafNO toxin-antitoxin module